MRWLFFFFLLLSSLEAKPLDISVQAEAAVLINAKTGKILFEKNAQVPMYPASTTKIATALFALYQEGHNPHQVFTAERESIASISPQAKKQSNYRSPPHWLETDGTHVGIKKGEEIALYDLLHMMLIPSANDAANVIAQGLGGSIPKFMEQLNVFLKSIGCQHTHFNSPHGFHHPEHVTTAFDLALMTKAALTYPLFRQIVATPRYTCPQTNLELERPLVQTNLLLKKGSYYYPQTIGVKTGFTQAAGKNLVAAAQNGEREVIAVALGYKFRADLYKDVKKMFDAALNEPKTRRTLTPRGEGALIVSVAGAKQKLKAQLSEPLSYEFYPSEESPVQMSIRWEIPPLPISKGITVGTICIADANGTVLKEVSLLASEDITPDFKHRFSQYMKGHKGGVRVGALLIAALCVLWLLSRRKPRR